MSREILDEYYGVGHIRCDTPKDRRSNPFHRQNCELLTLDGKPIAQVTGLREIETKGADVHNTRVNVFSDSLTNTKIDYLIPQNSGLLAGICQKIKVDERDIRLVCRRDSDV